MIAADSGICWIDGEAGVLAYRGIDIHELAEHSTFEETTYLLWKGLLPNRLDLRDFQTQLALARTLDPRIVEMLRGYPKTATPMEVLRTAVSALSFYDAAEKDNSHDANVRKAYNPPARRVHRPGVSGAVCSDRQARVAAHIPERDRAAS